MCVCVHVFICTLVCVCVHVFIYMYFGVYLCTTSGTTHYFSETGFPTDLELTKQAKVARGWGSLCFLSAGYKHTPQLLSCILYGF